LTKTRIQSSPRAGVPDERLGVPRVGLEHFEAAVASDVGNLKQVGATLAA
jgi:hypothetical protein